jgi:hypothetical protein
MYSTEELANDLRKLGASAGDSAKFDLLSKTMNRLVILEKSVSGDPNLEKIPCIFSR